VSAIPTQIECVECGGVAHLVDDRQASEPIEPGYPLVYRCADCLDRFDVVWEEDDEEA
jgi:DNA-directed RNA polymerase subunit RPC12/RpoP